MFLRTVALTGLAVIGLVACTTAPIYNVQSAPVSTASGKAVTATQVRGAIVAAGSNLGWVMSDARPGVLAGKLALRSHVAEVEIPYTEKTYSIVYKGSSNLNETGGSIHKNYNGWVQNLQRDINAKLSALN
ncbi:hypothetical protein BWI17_12640 [Betaproteobacteria bacterium GR16-43]|nr:hypothetical protein BWI17_12640 [Betaproteobacteria bacterium GR16-43]